MALSPQFIFFLTSLVFFGHVCLAAPASDMPKDGSDAKIEVDIFLADFVALPSSEQKKQLDDLIAQLPPDAAPGNPDRARRLLIAALNDGSDAIHHALWFAPIEKSAPIILETLAKGTPQDQRTALDLMGRVMAKNGKTNVFRTALPTLRKAVVSDDKSIRSYAISALQRMGEDGVPCLLAALANQEPLSIDTKRHFTNYSDLVIPELQKALTAGDPTRRNALQLLEWIAPEGKEIVPLLIPLLDENDSATRSSSAFVLGLYGSAARPAVPKMMKMIVSDDSRSRLAGSEALGRIGIEAAQIEILWPGVLRIEERGNNYNWFYNYGYAASSPGRAAVPTLINALSHPDTRVRRSATYACANLGPVAGSAALPLLKTASDNDGETAMGAIWALGNMGSTAAPATDGLISLFRNSEFRTTVDGELYFNPPNARALANIGLTVLPALYKGLSSDNIMVKAGCAKALGNMDPNEAKQAITPLLKMFDKSKDDKLRIVVLQALIALDADPKELDARLKSIVFFDKKEHIGEASEDGYWRSTLTKFAAQYLKRNKDEHRLIISGPGEDPYGYHINPADFSWGLPSAGMQIGLALQPIVYETQKIDPDINRLIVAVRNVGDQPVILPIYHSHLYGLDIKLIEEIDVLSPLTLGFKYPPGLRELRPGQIIITQPIVDYRLAYGKRNSNGRWTQFLPADKEYHVSVVLRGLGKMDPPHLPCYASEAIRKECWQGKVTSGIISTRLDSVRQRERAKNNT
jgi:HEAT repeat protein